MNSSPSPYLKVTFRASTQRGMRRTSSCSTCTHSTSPIGSGKRNTSGSWNGATVYQPSSSPAPASARSADQMTGGLRHSSMVVQMENDGAKIGSPSSPRTSRLAPSRTPSSSIAENRWSAAYRAKTSDRPGSTPMPTSASCPSAAQPVRLRELLVTQLDARQLVRALGVRAGQ